MTTVWTILGAVLITLVLAVCFLFFVMRPMLRKKLMVGAEGLSKELHGRPPLKASAASLDSYEGFVKDGIRGLGALGLTEEAVVFVSGAGTSLIIARSSILSATTTTSISGGGLATNRNAPKLVISWKKPDGTEPQVAFSVDSSAQEWADEIGSFPGFTLV